MTNKEFAEKNAGEYFQWNGRKVRVVGYCANNEVQILVSVPAHEQYFGWGAGVLDGADVFVIRPKASRYRYVGEFELSAWK